MLSIGKTAQIVKEERNYKVHVLGISECRWAGFGKLRTAKCETILYSFRADDIHQSGVPLLLDKRKPDCGNLVNVAPKQQDSTHNT